MTSRVYSPPIFNLEAFIWWEALPADLSTWDGSVPSPVPDVRTDCQLYFPKFAVGHWLHAYNDSPAGTALKSVGQELRMPFGTDVRAPWGVSSELDWTAFPLVEVPAHSGRLYVAVLMDERHLGFPNQYTVALLAQIGPVPPNPPPPPPHHYAHLGVGVAFRGTAPVIVPAALGLGIAATAKHEPPPLAADLGAGLAAGISGPPGAGLGVGLGAAIAADPAKIAADLGIGHALEVDVGPGPTGRSSLGIGVLVQAQELLPSAVKGLGVGQAIDNSGGSTGGGRDLGIGVALTADVTQLDFVNPCATIGVPHKLLATCLTQSGSLSGWVGQNVTLTYIGSGTDWTGTLTKGGHSGTVTFHGTGSGTYQFSGISGTDWTISGTITDDTCSCGPPFSSTTANHSTFEGLNSGNTTWSLQPA